MDETRWLSNLRIFLYNTVINFVPRELGEKYVDTYAMVIWRTAFTDRTVSDDNYEKYEYLGDSILKGVFPWYLSNKYPALTEKQYTELNASYMSGDYQPFLSKTLGLDKYVRTRFPTGPTSAILTDVFESFTKALFDISDRIAPGSGFLVCYNMIFYLFRSIEIDLNKGRGSPKTQVEQIFQRFNLSVPTHKTIAINDGFRTIIKLTDDDVNFLAQYPPVGRQDVSNLRTIAQAEGLDARTAKKGAYILALQTLTDYGYSPEWAEKVKHERDFKDAQIIPNYLTAAQNQAAKDGYTDIYFDIPSKTTTVNYAVVQLRGKRAGGINTLLASAIADDKKKGWASGKNQVLKIYSGSR